MTTKNGYVRTEKDHLFDLMTNYKLRIWVMQQGIKWYDQW